MAAPLLRLCHALNAQISVRGPIHHSVLPVTAEGCVVAGFPALVLAFVMAFCQDVIELLRPFLATDD